MNWVFGATQIPLGRGRSHTRESSSVNVGSASTYAYACLGYAVLVAGNNPGFGVGLNDCLGVADVVEDKEHAGYKNE